MTARSRLRWGVLGAARVTERILPALVDAENAELVAVASRRPGAAATAVATHVPAATGVDALDDTDALLRDPRIDAVWLPMANEEHAEWALRAVAAGKHVLVEKPLALSVADVDAITAAAAEHGVTVMEGFMYVFHPQFARAQEILRSGAIGEIRSVRSNFSFPMKPARLYRVGRDTAHGGGAMWDVGPYAIHTLRQAFGAEPESAVAVARYNDSGADIVTSGVLDFGEGRHGHFDAGFDRARRSEYEVIGTTGGLTCDVVWQQSGTMPVLTWWSDDGRTVREHLPWADHFVREVEHFGEVVLDGATPALSLADARGNAAALAAVQRAAAEGRRVDVER